MQKLSWAVTAGDQVGDSEDDQPCGDHFIDKDLECHDGDAHRPTPGKNPYFQGDRKGPQDKSKTPERSGGEKNQRGHERDRSQHTQQNKERMLTLLDQGHTPESLGRDNVNHFADMMEENYGRPLTDKDVHTLVDMVNQKMGESFSQDPAQKGIHDPTAPKGFKGPKGREMSRPDTYHKETTDDAYTPGPGGGPEEGGLYDHYKNILKDRISDGGDDGIGHGGDGWGGDEAWENEEEQQGDDKWLKEDEHLNQPSEEGPSQEMKDEQDKWDGPGYQGEQLSEDPDRDKKEPGPYEYQDRHMDEWSGDETPEETDKYRRGERRKQTQKEHKRRKDAKKKSESSLAPSLTWGRIMQDRVDDIAEGRPCGDGEDPKKGKCNDGTTPPPSGAPVVPPSGGGGGGKPPKKPGMRPEGPAGPINKDYRMHDKLKGPQQDGIGLAPSQDAGREARMAENLSYLTQDDATDSKQTTNLMAKMMGGAPKPQPDGTSMVGSQAATPQEAKQQNDDYRDTLTKSGWETHSEMGNKSVFKKGNTAVVLERKNNGNQMKIKNLKPAAPRGRR